MADQKKAAPPPPVRPSMRISGEEMFDFLLGDLLTARQWIDRRVFQEIAGKDCTITLEPRPPHCDRGNFLAKLHPTGSLALEIDGQDGWPRYYFDESRAKREVEAWLRKRGQWRDA